MKRTHAMLYVSLITTALIFSSGIATQPAHAAGAAGASGKGEGGPGDPCIKIEKCEVLVDHGQAFKCKVRLRRDTGGKYTGLPATTGGDGSNCTQWCKDKRKEKEKEYERDDKQNNYSKCKKKKDKLPLPPALLDFS